MKKEFEQFIALPGEAPPPAVTERVMSEVRAELSPSTWAVFGKLVAVHAAVSIASLSVCPQFNVRVLGEGPGLMGQFMEYGDAWCHLLCGAFYLGSSALVAALLFSRPELRVLKRARWTVLPPLAGLSLGVFALAQAELTLAWVAFWLAGALVAAGVMIEALGRLRLVASPQRA